MRTGLSMWLGQKLRDIRVRKGLSQEAVERAGIIEQGALSHIELGRWPRNSLALERLLLFYGFRLQIEPNLRIVEVKRS